jgi:hypothetical protein
MAMTRRVSVTLDARSEAALYRIMQCTGWTKSQALRESIKAAAKSEGAVPRPSRRATKKVKVKS